MSPGRTVFAAFALTAFLAWPVLAESIDSPSNTLEGASQWLRN